MQSPNLLLIILAITCFAACKKDYNYEAEHPNTRYNLKPGECLPIKTYKNGDLYITIDLDKRTNTYYEFNIDFDTNSEYHFNNEDVLIETLINNSGDPQKNYYFYKKT